MFRNLFTPLRSRFDAPARSPSPAPPLPTSNSFYTASPTPTASTIPTATSFASVKSVLSDDDVVSPEEFARDVLVQLMRNSIDNLKAAEDLKLKTEVLSEVQRIMLQDECTKDVFREMDGFLVLMSVLSTIKSSRTTTPTHSDEDALAETLEAARLVFMILSEAMHEYPSNAEYFAAHIGFESLQQAIGFLVSDPLTKDQTIGFLFSLSLHDFSLSGIVTTMRMLEKDHDQLDFQISQLGPRLGMIRKPGAMNILWNLLPTLGAGSAALRYGFYRVFELLASICHRNLALLSTLGFVKPIIQRLYEPNETETVSEQERHVLLKLLKRLLEMGATTAEARSLFKRAIAPDNTLDEDITAVIPSAMKSRWPEHFSMESGAALSLDQESIKGMPIGGFTFMIWLRFERLPSKPMDIFCVKMSTRPILTLSVRSDGIMEFWTIGNREPAIFAKACVALSRWTHVTIVQYSHKGSNPSVRLFLDGVLNDTLQWQYPKHESQGRPGTYVLGGGNKSDAAWCIASAYLLSLPLPDDYPRLVHHLGPRYAGSFQDPHVIKFLTYEASTSLSVFLASVMSSDPFQKEPSPLIKAVRDGFGISEASVSFAVSPARYLSEQNSLFPSANSPRTPTGSFAQKQVLHGMWRTEGDIFVVDARCLDMALWKIGGAAIGLRLVQVANTPHQLSRSLSILTDGIRNSWRNSDDMERLRGYDILGDILRSKGQLINMTGFENIFEFLGLNFRTPDRSTIVNSVAYRAIALDFDLWARTRKEIQCAHLDHFRMLLETSRLRKFNLKQRISKMGLLRKVLFALQTDWYQNDMVPFVVDALKVIAQAHFSTDDTIKPMISYLAANLHDSPHIDSPRSAAFMSHIDTKNSREKAAQVLEAMVSLLKNPTFYSKFATALPLARVCLLLLGDKPSSFVASQVLLLISVSLNASPSFNRKFELVSGWSALKVVLPASWDASVHEAAFDVLLGRFGSKGNGPRQVSCPHIMPAILAALQKGLISVAKQMEVPQSPQENGHAAELTNETDTSSSDIVEVLIEELIDLHASCASFRDIFKSQQTTKLFIDAYKSFVSAATCLAINATMIRILEKLTHFGLSLALDPSVAGTQKREILDSLQSAETILNSSSEKTAIDPALVADRRSVATRITSARLSLQLGERVLQKTLVRMHEWRKAIVISERKRLRKHALDLQENRRQVARLHEWTLVFTTERGLWDNPNKKILWRLDETEGPHRIRKKLEPQDEILLSSRVDGFEEERPIEPDTDSDSVVHVEQPPWAEAYEITATEVEDDKQLAEEITEDKHRRVRHDLEPGDIIEAISTVARIAGVDSSPGLLIFGQTHLYMLDGLVEDDHGEVVDAHDAPRRLFFVPGSIVELNGPQKARRWTYDQVASLSDRTFLFRDVALELYFKDSRSLLIVFADKKRRRDMHQRLTSLMPKEPVRELRTAGMLRTPLFGPVGAKVLMGFRADDLSTAQRKWQTREISTYTYLTVLNQISGRTPSDATQYPIFPWALKDYTSDKLDLTSQESFRDLTKPMGALTESRREAARMRYTNLESVGEKPFHYGTHFSSSMIVCHFLIRLAPFTNMFKTLQGGDWDLPDRLFVDIARAYESASQDVRGDVRELIPEFFTCPEFLENSSNLDFGVQQNTGEKIHDVKLPPWAKKDPLLFVVLNRQALESDYVSANLPTWIDLIWGCKQRDPEALNVFHPLSYEGSIDLDSITDELEREATVGIIHNFGQTPRKLFYTPHPPRYMDGPSTLPLGSLNGIAENPHLLLQGNKALKDLGPGTAVRELLIDSISERVIPCPEGVLFSPSGPHEQVQWGGKTKGGELRVLIDDKVVQVIEGASCVCAAWADPLHLVTGSSDHIVRIWKVSREGSRRNGASREMYMNFLNLSHVMRVHSAEVISITASRSWSVIVSGSKDGSAAIWDLNKGVYVRSIWHGNQADAAVHLVAVNESTGYIATCSRRKLCLHTINARPMATLDLLSSSALLPPPIVSMAFHERDYSPIGVIATGGPDGTIALRTWNTDNTPPGEKARWEFVTLRTMKIRGSPDSGPRPSCITALRFWGENLAHGEDTGKTFQWTLPD